jgi:Zn-dependent protease
MPNDLQSAREPVPIECPNCGSEVAPTLLSCPSCRKLVHSARLKELAQAAEASEAEGNLSAALQSWRDATELLPPETRQYQLIGGHIARLGRLVEAGPSARAKAQAAHTGAQSSAEPSRPSGGVISGVIATVAIAVWKFKVIALLLLTKGKLLLLGLTKASTFFSMFASMGVYWTVFGGWLAVGLVLSIYVHEMGHVFALMRYGVKASAPLFVPGWGAVILLKQELFDPKQDARVGLAGPIWGTGAALACAGIYELTSVPIWAALARWGAIINLFNLTPVWQLDGSRAFRSLSRQQRWLAVASVAAAWAVTDQGLLVLLLAVGVWRTILDKPAKGSDAPIVAQYAILVMILSALSQLPVPMGLR